MAQDFAAFEALFNPRGIAVVGSASPGKLGNVLVSRLVEGGFSQVYPINPKAMGVGERPGYTSVTEVREPVDMALICCPVSIAAAALEDCGKGGVKAACIITSGFREAGNAAAEEEILAVAQKYGIRFAGPNCAGLLNTHADMYATLETSPNKGNVALVSQSGSVGGIFMSWAMEQGLGISKFVSYGNCVDWDVTDYLLYLKDDADTRVIALYLEQITDGRRFMEVCQAVTKVKPIVIIKSGRTGAGGRAAMSHTGSMAGEDSVNDEALRECGAIRVESVSEMFSLCKALAGMPLVQGNKILIITNSGGPAIMACDKGEELGLRIEEPSAELKERLRTFLPAHAGLNNPIDMTVEATADWYGRTLTEALPEYDGAVAVFVGTPYLEAMPIAKAVVEAAHKTEKPVIASFVVGTDIKESLEYLYEQGIPNFLTGEETMWVFHKLLTYFRHLDKDGAEASPSTAIGRAGVGKSILLEPKVMELLSEQKLPVPEHIFVEREADLAAACGKIGYPLVLKIVSPTITHKSDVGGVKLNLKNYHEAETAYAELKQIGGADFAGAMVYPMLPGGGIEVILGIKRDPAFGPVMLFGLGGIYSEIFKDVVLRISPITETAALEMIKSITAYPLLAGARGRHAKDIQTLAKVMADFSQLPHLYPDIQEIDLNPVLVYEDGVVIADARFIL